MNTDVVEFLQQTLWTWFATVVPLLAVTWLWVAGRAARGLARITPGPHAPTRPDDVRAEVWTALFIVVVMIVPPFALVLLALVIWRKNAAVGFLERVGAIVLTVLALVFQAGIIIWLVLAANWWPPLPGEAVSGRFVAHLQVALGFVCVPFAFLILATAAVSSERRTFRWWGALAFAAHAIYALTLLTYFVAKDKLRFFNPEAFWFLLLVPVFVLLWMKSQALMQGTRRVASLCFRLLLLVALTIAAAQPQVVRTQDGMAVVFVVDRSLSMPDNLLHDWYARYINDKFNAVPPDQRAEDQHAVVVFGGDPALIRQLDAGIDVHLIEPDDLANDITDLAAAMRQALAIFPDDRRKRIVLLTDGNENRGDVVADLRLARHYGVTVDVVEVRAERRKTDVRIERLDQPGEVKMGQRFEPRLVIWSSTECEAKLTIRVNGVPESMPADMAERMKRLTAQRNEILGRLPLDNESLQIVEEKLRQLQEMYPPPTIWLKPGRNYPVLPARRYDTPGFYEMSVEVEVAPEFDQVPQNNSGTAFTVVRGRRRILFVYGDTLAHNEPFLTAINDVFRLDARDGMAPPTIDVVDAGRMPRELAEWRMYDCVVLSNVSLDYWKEDQQRKLVAAIHRFGTGLVVLGGDKSYGAGGYRDQPLVEALPVRMEVEEMEAELSGALVIVLHTCEIDAWNAHTKAMCQAALDALSDMDQLGIVLYDYSANTGASWLFKLQKIGGMRAQMKQLITNAAPGDMPSFGPAFGLAYQALKTCNANKKRCVVISDGDPSQPRLDLVAGCFQLNPSVGTSAILVQPHGNSDAGTMKSIAKAGGDAATWQERYYEILQGAKLNLLPQIFTREAVLIRSSLLHNGTFLPQITNQAEFLRGAAGMPSLRGFVGVTVKPMAQEALRVISAQKADDGSGLQADPTAKSHPLLAYWQHGLGRVVCFTSDVTNPGWCADWTGHRWTGYRRFWGDVVNWTARQARADDDRVAMHAELVDGRGHVVIDAVDDGTPLMFANAQLTVVDPGERGHPVRLRLIEPGRYEGWFDAPRQGSWQINLLADIAGEEDEGIPVMLTGGISVPYAREFRDLDANSGLLATIATFTNGKYVRGQLVPVGGLGGVPGGEQLFLADTLLRNDVLVNPQNFSETIRDAEGQPIDYDPFARDLPVTHSFTPTWRPFAIAALFLLFIDIFFRKVFVSWSQLNETLAPAFAGVPLAGRLFVARSDVPLEEMERLRSVKALVASRQQSARDQRAKDVGDVLAKLKSGKGDALPAPRAVKVENERAARRAGQAADQRGESGPAEDRDFLKKLKDKAKGAAARASDAPGPDLTRPPTTPGAGAGAGAAPADAGKGTGGGGLFDRLRDAKRGALDDRDDDQKKQR